jgi:large subunit ribosomal protein L21
VYAVIESGGMQFEIREGEKLKIPKIKAGVGEKISFDKVLLIGKDGENLVGTPYITGAKVEGEVLSFGKAEKVTVFKFKRRVKYRRKKGHRQDFCEVRIEKIEPASS